MKVSIQQTANGYIVEAAGTIKKNGVYVFRSIDIIPLIEFIGNILLDHPIQVTEK